MITDQNKTGQISYYANIDPNNPYSTGKYFNQNLWIKRIAQQINLDGQSYQSKFTRHFYPRYFSPGNFTITCIADSQKTYQDTARFIRGHHQFLANTPIFSTTGSYGLISLRIPSEDIYYQGIIDRIVLNKRGVFDPAPEFNFTYIVLYDSNRTNDAKITSSLRQWHQPNVGDALDIIDNTRK